MIDGHALETPRSMGGVFFWPYRPTFWTLFVGQFAVILIRSAFCVDVLDMDFTLIMLSMLFGLIGMGMFTYGKRMDNVSFLGAGLALMVVPYFIPSAIALLIVCVLLTAAPYFIAT
jgi:hypothetical protein